MVQSEVTFARAFAELQLQFQLKGPLSWLLELGFGHSSGLSPEPGAA